MVTHVHKVIHLVVGTFEQGLETSPAECPLVECGHSDGTTDALYRKDRDLQSDRTLRSSVRSVTVESTLSQSCDQTL